MPSDRLPTQQQLQQLPAAAGRAPTPLVPVLPARPGQPAWPLHDLAASRRVEAEGLAATRPQALMGRAGLAVARLALAVAPHARRIWVAAGPGNNGGDALVAARHLQAWGREVVVTWLGHPDQTPDDARHAWAEARDAGVLIEPALPAQTEADLCLDGLLGIGASRPPAGPIAEAIRRLNNQAAPVLAIDLPSGLSADRGQPLGEMAVVAAHTLALLTLKPGLFTGAGRDHAGRVWLDTLGRPTDTARATAWLGAAAAPPPRRHVQHKGSFGDLVVLGGAEGMGGAAVLAARAGLAAGAGRVYLARLGGDPLAVDPHRPELMPRSPAQVLVPEVLRSATVVCGCGGGSAVAGALPAVLAEAERLVLDADALNALAADPALWPLLAARGRPTVLTPHPLEAARLLGCTAAEVQADRIAAATRLAERAQATVLLKGSGTVIAAPGRPPVVNPTGHARLGTAGSGDVLAGWLGAWLAADTAWPQSDGGMADPAFGAACAAAWWHGHAGEQGAPGLPLQAGDLANAMAAAVANADAAA